MKTKIGMVAFVAALVLCTIATNAQTINITITNDPAVDLQDTSSANADVVKATKSMVTKFSQSGQKYGQDMKIKLLPTDSVVVITEVSNVSSDAHKGKPETQWLVVVTPKKGENRIYLDKQSDPTQSLTDGIACLSTATGCGVKGEFVYATKAGDSEDEPFSGSMK